MPTTTDLELQKLQDLKRLSEYKGEDRVILAKSLLEEIKSDTPKMIYKTGFAGLDRILGGFRRGQLVVISAATGQGKTSFAQTLTEKFISDGHKCLWFSYEVGIEEFMEKMPEGGKAFYLPRQIKQNSITWLKERTLEGIAKYNSRVIFIDHLHYLLEMQKMAEAKSLSLLIGMMLRELKKIAIEQEVLIFLISHIRKIATAEAPDLEDLRDSSFVAQESDAVLMMWRLKEKVNGEIFYTNKAKVAVRKNRRTGSLGEIKLEYVNNHFTEKEEEQTPTQIYHSII